MAVLKVIDVVGISQEGWEAVARAAVAEASRTVRQIEELEVVRSKALVRDGAIVEYQMLVRLTFRVEDAAESLEAVEAAQAILSEPAAQPPTRAVAEPAPERRGGGERRPR